jgi:hypothetical protein
MNQQRDKAIPMPKLPKDICRDPREDLLSSACISGAGVRGIARLTGLAYNTVVSIIREASQRAQMLHNQEVKAVETEAVSIDEMW